MKANDMQVGGDHYRSSLQHWDVVSQYNVPYLEGCASKYVSRWRKKNGLQDLQKALHFTTKLKEVIDNPELRYVHGTVPFQVIERFVIANDLEMNERHVLLMLWSWSSREDVASAINVLNFMIQEAERAQEERRDN
jgi:hypothetical protein